jgi:hypothetical protein
MLPDLTGLNRVELARLLRAAADLVEAGEGALPATAHPPHPLQESARVMTCFTFISLKPGISGKDVARLAGCEDATFFHLVPRLKKLGVTCPRGKGYWPPA